MKTAKHASGYALMVAITSVLGLLREVIVARNFGTSLEMDCFIAAFAIVSFIGYILNPQTMQTMLMPSYLDALARSKQAGSIFINNIGVLLIMILLAGVLVGYIFAPYIVAIAMPGFDQNQILLTQDLLRIMIPLILIQGLVSLGHTLCNAHRHFIYPLTSQILNSLIVLCLLMLLPIDSVYRLAWYYITGASISAIIPLTAYKKLVPYRRVSHSDHSYFYAIHSTWPLLIIALVDQASQLLPRSVASLLESGDITALNYGFRLITLPVSMIAMAISSVLFPSIIEHVREAPERVIDPIRRGTAILFYCLVPISVVMAVDSNSLVHIVFSSGNFNALATERTASSLEYYAFGIVGLGYLMFLNRIYCAYRYYWLYAKATLGAFVLLIILSLALIQPMGHDGIALAFSLYCYFTCVILILCMRRFTTTQIISIATLTRITISTAIAAAILWQWHTDSFWPFITKVSLFTVLYASGLWVSRDPNLLFACARIRELIPTLKR
jgi:putative peptidoglycan lipid II flippase